MNWVFNFMNQCFFLLRCSIKIECINLLFDYWFLFVKKECFSLEFQNYFLGFVYKLDKINIVLILFIFLYDYLMSWMNNFKYLFIYYIICLYYGNRVEMVKVWYG